ncbi:hypothetical protein [Phytoactinopolyspora limicola]|uniref:hypothetical protein n=1 Tax=Phytoactinopolyspora limicola TaxID=2715536 RepID=UPI0014088FFB|nr:hypothetical protein [Phytoactinopolyspora limicola]
MEHPEQPSAAQVERELPDRHADLLAVLESAAELQQRVPDAVLVGGSAAALYAGHRVSYDHDHVLHDLKQRFDVVLDALEREGDWVTNRAAAGKVVLGELGGIESGVRQLRRATPLETIRVRLPSDQVVTVPTFEETLRIKGFLIVARNAVRDYLDVAALSDRYGAGPSARVFSDIDRYYSDVREGSVITQLTRQLADPQPKDSRVLRRLRDYKGLHPRWHDWTNVASQCQQVARLIAYGDYR